MGNCLHRVEPSFSLDQNRSQVLFSDYDGNFSYEDNVSYEFPDDYSMDSAAPCHSCNLLDESALPFFIITSVLGVLASGAVLFALLRPLFHWQICPGWSVLAQLAVGSALFSLVVPILAPGLSSAHNTVLCGLGYWVWYSSAFAQALLIGCYSCLKPKLGAGQIQGLTLGLTVGVWGVAAIIGFPITLTTDTHHGLCTIASSRGLGALRSTHSAICFTIFALVPLGFLLAKGLKKALGMGPGPWVNVLWVWYIFWFPHGVVLVFDALVRSKVLLLPTCPVQQSLDVMLHLAEALAMVHCMATPILLALFYHQTTHTFLPSLPLSTRPSSHMDTIGVKA